MDKFVVYKEKTVVYGTIVEAEDEVDAYEKCDSRQYLTNSFLWAEISTQDENLLEDEPEELDLNSPDHTKVLSTLKETTNGQF